MSEGIEPTREPYVIRPLPPLQPDAEQRRQRFFRALLERDGSRLEGMASERYQDFADSYAALGEWIKQYRESNKAATLFTVDSILPGPQKVPFSTICYVDSHHNMSVKPQRGMQARLLFVDTDGIRNARYVIEDVHVWRRFNTGSVDYMLWMRRIEAIDCPPRVRTLTGRVAPLGLKPRPVNPDAPTPEQTQAYLFSRQAGRTIAPARWTFHNDSVEMRERMEAYAADVRAVMADNRLTDELMAGDAAFIQAELSRPSPEETQ